MTKTKSVHDPEALKAELTRIRHESLLATRLNDYRRMARLTLQAAELNKALRESLRVQ